jgi:hypothetical protein
MLKFPMQASQITLAAILLMSTWNCLAGPLPDAFAEQHDEATPATGAVNLNPNGTRIGIQSVPFSVDISGPLNVRSITIHLFPTGAYLNTPIQAFVAAEFPDGRLYFKDSSGAWIQFTGGTPPPIAIVTVPTGNQLNLFAAKNEDLVAYVGVKVHAGFGYSYEDMFSKGMHSFVYTVAP